VQSELDFTYLNSLKSKHIGVEQRKTCHMLSPELGRNSKLIREEEKHANFTLNINV